ncbi:UDP-N-acetylmuramoyl-tripeptide--D-alanyl-D-alanine ligase [Acaryochloris sp. IP29b_bin.137]|uniref:UDP-N-acetylmuramoyl-tripeptide--D-alanyl-D- alanine ligase n=1 Tax=Acaryochloris sp. IP29b_bin.137 TaxID=2969217 RepID=UPI00261D151B|nr:UDP-N-acetylmuramoyl-tripeptide--D-alanyl-D-alanine ligase [Acaryochloris sp. IP29b_bin.137]
MTLQAPLAQLIEVLSAQPLNLPSALTSQQVQGVNTDTRSLKPNEIFLALSGEQFDGHRFAKQAVQQGAIAAIVDHSIDAAIPQLVVPNTLVAYQRLGQWWRQQFQIPIIAITGSVGKTTTKELISAVLGTAGSVLKTEANYNNEIGVPKTLLGLTPDHDYAVVEMGMRGPGEIAELAQIAQPTIGVITNVGTAHIGRLGSREAIANAKCELLAQMPSDSFAILNADNPLLIETAKTVWQGAQVTYGLESGDVRGRLEAQTLQVEGDVFPLPLPGAHNALNYLAALAIARHLNLDLAPLRQGISLQLPSGRARKLTLPNDVVILDETYNAGLESMQAALHLLAQTPGQRRIAVLGPMKELGDYAPELHRQVGNLVQTLNIDQLLILDQGPEGTALAAGTTTVPTEQFGEHQALMDYLDQHIQPGDCLLCKASHSVGLERIVDHLTQAKA